jgi:2-oxo-3-hexenedioate decarboxylase
VWRTRVPPIDTARKAVVQGPPHERPRGRSSTRLAFVLGAHEIKGVAAELLEALASATPMPPITERLPAFELADSYEVLRVIATVRAAQGWRPVGRKIGFTNRTIWNLYNVEAPMWAHMWDHTVEYATSATASVTLDGVLEPRIEPEVVMKLRGPVPTTGAAVDVLESVEWIAAGFELVQSVFPGWRFALPECTAAFGLHGRLIVGPPMPVTPERRAWLAEELGVFEATLRRDDEVVDRGVGSNTLGSPALALRHLAEVVAGQPRQPPLADGEIITTGTLTDAWPVHPGERWSSDYGTLGVTGLTVEFT